MMGWGGSGVFVPKSMPQAKPTAKTSKATKRKGLRTFRFMAFSSKRIVGHSAFLALRVEKSIAQTKENVPSPIQGMCKQTLSGSGVRSLPTSGKIGRFCSPQ